MEPQKRLPKPAWIKARLPAGDEWKKVDDILAKNNLHTVCDEAHCPNKGECWGCGTATFMVLGDICTRGCRFCAVATARDGRPLRADEPEALAAAVGEMGLSYAVITSVDRDDLPDRGAAPFRPLRRGDPRALAFRQDRGSDPRLHRRRARHPGRLGARRARPQRRDGAAAAARSRREGELRPKPFNPAPSARERHRGDQVQHPPRPGRDQEELLATYEELRGAGVDILVMGQYLQPTANEIPVVEYVPPDTFAVYAEDARRAGFSTVVASPFARDQLPRLWTRGRPSADEGEGHRQAGGLQAAQDRG